MPLQKKPKSVVHLLDDAWLQPYADHIRVRAARMQATMRKLAGPHETLSNWAQAYNLFGLHRTTHGWTFREWAPNATDIWLVGDFSNWERHAAYQLKKGPDDIWSRTFPVRAFRHLQHYRLDICWPGGEGERLPAYVQRVEQDENTNLFSAQVWQPRKAYQWQYRRPQRAQDSMPLIYEAHVGMAQEEASVGSYVAFRDKILPRIKEAGYTIVQLMGIMEHPYYGSFGYHVSNFFAPSSRFGTPEELMSLIDTAHGMGLRVIMDLVHSHAVRNERDGLSLFDGTLWQYFHDGSRGWHSAWDSRCFDYAKVQVLQFLLSNCRYWLETFHFDGFRFDGVTSMLYHDHGLGTNFCDYAQYFSAGVDEDAWVYLALANHVIHKTNPYSITIAEDVSGMPGCAAPLEDCGMGFDYRMAMGIPDFWFKLAEKVRDEDWQVGTIWWELTNHRAEEHTVAYVESHDQALVGGKTFFFQLVDAAIYNGMRLDQESLAIARGIALHKMARLITCALASTAYLNFMGNEFGHPEWIDFPRAENGWSFAHARRQWSLRDDPALRFKGLADFDATMLACIGKHRQGDPVRLECDEPNHVLAFWRNDLVYVFNFDPNRSYEGYAVMVPPGYYRPILNTDEKRFGGQGRIAEKMLYQPIFVRRDSENIQKIRLYLPARTAIVLKRTLPRKGKNT